MKTKAIEALKRAKDTVVDKASDVISAPKRAYYGVKRAHSEHAFKKLKQERAMREMDAAGAPDAGNESSPLFRYRISELNKAFDKEQEREQNR